MSEIESEDDRLAKGKVPALSEEDQGSLNPKKEKPLAKDSSSGVFADADGNQYTITDFLGDLDPSQFYRAEYKKARNEDGSTSNVALKIRRIDKNEDARVEARNEFNGSLKKNDHQSFNKVVKVTKYFEHEIQDDDTRLLGVMVMPYMEFGSLRYIMSRKQHPRRMPERCVGMVLQETLWALTYLHGWGRFNTKVDAGFVYVTRGNPVAIKLGYISSLYYHNPNVSRPPPKIYSNDFSGSSDVVFPLTKENADRLTYWGDPPERRQNSAAFDIWNVGIMALELTFGPPEVHGNQKKRRPAQYYDVIKRIRKTKNRLPTLQELFFLDNTIEEEVGGTGKYLKKATKKLGSYKRKLVCWVSGTEGPLDDEDGRGGCRMSRKFANMVRRCLVKPHRRPTAAELLGDSYFETCGLDMQYFHDNVLKDLQN